MKKTLSSLLLLLAGVLTVTSCLDSNDNTDYTYYGDTAITAFTLGTVKREVDSTITSGSVTKDTTYSTTVAGSSYTFVIDQTKGEIYNPDSLPYGCKTSAVLATISAKNSGYVYIKSLTSDSLTYYSSSDSIDFSQPRTLQVIAQDGQRYRVYTVRVNVHQQKSGQLQWSQQTSLPAALGANTTMKAVACNGSLYLFTPTTAYGYTDGAWTTLSPSNTAVLSADACKSMLAWQGSIYTAIDGTVLRSADGQTWETVATGTAAKQLVAASSKELYALADGGIVASADGGATWTTETLDNAASLLPTSNIGYSCQAVKTNDNIERVTFVGTQDGAAYVKAWSKLADYSDHPSTYQWSYVDNAGSLSFALPAYTSLQVLSYNKQLWAFGLQNNTLVGPFVSADGGLAWRKSSAYTLPSSFTTSGTLAATVDADNYIWFISTDGSVWRGRLNNLAW